MRAAAFRWAAGGRGRLWKCRAGKAEAIVQGASHTEVRLPKRGARRVWSGGRENARRQAQEDRADVGASATA